MDRGAWQAAVQFSSVQSLSCVQLFVTPWTAARQASLSITNSCSLLKLIATELAMPFNHLILCHWNSPGKNTEVGNLSLLQGILPTQGSNPCLLHCRWILYQLSYG